MTEKKKQQIVGNECIGVRRGGWVRGPTVGNDWGFLHSQTGSATTLVQDIRYLI